MASERSVDLHASMLRSWHLAVLRFAVTSENADRVTLFAAAREIDGLGRWNEDQPSFGFFRKTSSELCAAILKRDEATNAILQEYLARIDDVRLKRALGAALGFENAGAVRQKRRSRPADWLWRGLPPRSKIHR